MTDQFGVLPVAWREVRWIFRDGPAFLLMLGVPIIAFILLAWTFSGAVVRDLRIAIVDDDHSEMSARIVEHVAGSFVAQETLQAALQLGPADLQRHTFG